ncbi:MAG: glycosyltransferase [Tepidisphaeraceae bacterium]
MISLFVPIRNATDLARQCLQSLAGSCRSLHLEQAVQYVLLDDASEARCNIPQLMLEFRTWVSSPVQILRFKAHHHYTSACAYGFSASRGAQVILVSHDMIVTPSYLRTLLAVAASDPSLGIIRGTSAHMDNSVNKCVPSIPLSSYEDILRFSAHVAEVHGLSVAPEPILVGDSMLIQRSVLEKIGVMDQRFVGFLGDMDFGLRAQRAGFKIVCAKGAWLHHVGCGTINADLAAGRAQAERVKDGLSDLDRAYEQLRRKWPVGLPASFGQLTLAHIEALRGSPPPQGGEYVPPVTIDPAVCEVL